MAEKKRTNGATPRKDDEAELRARVVAEFNAAYAANVPKPGDERARALAIVAELRAAIDRCSHEIRANTTDAPKAMEELRRMRRAMRRVASEEDLAPTELVPVLGVMRHFVKKKGHDPRQVLGTLRELFAESTEGWTDAEIVKVLRSDNFNVAMAKALSDHGYPMGPSNIDRLRRSRKTS